MAGGVSPAFVQVVGAVCADRSRQGLAEDASAAFTRGVHFLAGATTHHMHYVQRAIDLGMRNFELMKRKEKEKTAAGCATMMNTFALFHNNCVLMNTIEERNYIYL